MYTWGWRTKPRSTIKTIQWFPEFAKLEGKNWNLESNHNSILKFKIHPIRREYTFNAHGNENQEIEKLSLEQYKSGLFDKNETEGDARNDKTTFEFYGLGYVNKDGIIKTTQVGNLVIENHFDEEIFLKQLLKMQFPNFTYNKSELGKWHIFPMKLLINALSKFDSLNRSEIVLLFGCTDIKQLNKTLMAIKDFKNQYANLSNKQKDVKELCKKIFIKTYETMPNDINSYYDYADAFSRALIYTGIFTSHGPGIAGKIRVAEHAKLKFELLQNEYSFEKKDFKNIDEYFAWFGNESSITLPWDNSDNRKKLILEKINLLKKTQKEVDSKSASKIEQDLLKISNILNTSKTETDNKILEQDLIKYITNLREANYIENLAFTKESREDILKRFNLILKNDEMSALWLEVNTWKSLLAIRGDKQIKRNFNIEEDLTPKSFAPGIGNTPDMELYTNENIILPEVSLMTGIRQWEHEGSSVIDHVFRFIKENDDKNVFGLFISSSINIRTKWQFFILNKESWIGKPVPVIPMTITMYTDVINHIYQNEINIDNFIELIKQIHKLSLQSKDFETWYENSEHYIQQWKSEVA